MLRQPAVSGRGALRSGAVPPVYLPHSLSLTRHQQRCRPVHFKENESQEVIARRAAEEEVRRRQEQSIQDKPQTTTSSQQPVQRNGPADGQSSSSSSAHMHTTTTTVVSTNPVKVDFWVPAFTRRREVFMGRLAMVGFFAACFWEVMLPTHPNIMQAPAQLLQSVGIQVGPSSVEVLLLLSALYGLLAFAPWAPTYSRENLKDVAARPLGPPAILTSPLDYQRFLGITDWGFSKANELFHGRLAMLGFAAALWQQLRMGGVEGPGPIAQVAMMVGAPVNDTLYAAVPTAFYLFVGLAIALAAKNGRLLPPTSSVDNDIY